jgi:putative transposase
MFLYRTIDSNGDTVEFWFSERRNLTAAKRFLRKALERHGRPERIVIDGSQTNWEAILSCDTTDQLQDRSRRKLKPIPDLAKCLLEQSHRSGPSCSQAAGQTDARLQVRPERSYHSVRDRDGAHDAQATGEVCS